MANHNLVQMLVNRVWTKGGGNDSPTCESLHGTDFNIVFCQARSVAESVSGGYVDLLLTL